MTRKTKRDTSMKERECWRCGKGFSPGSLVYVAHIRVFADFDGVLLEPEREMEHQLQRLIDQTENTDPEELEKEVYEEYSLLLCKSCRDRFVDETQRPWEGPFRIPKDPKGLLH